MHGQIQRINGGTPNSTYGRQKNEAPLPTSTNLHD
jgi:hypothetical protein